jgi:hypothetical protein
MVRRYIYFVIVAATVALLSGCGTGVYQKDTALERNWGKSFESARYRQILNPEAGKEPEPVMGLDGDAAVLVLEKYRKSFEKTETQNVYNIDVFGMGTSK